MSLFEGNLIKEGDTFKIRYKRPNSSKFKRIDVPDSFKIDEKVLGKTVRFEITKEGTLKSILFEGEKLQEQIQEEEYHERPLINQPPPQVGYIQALIARRPKGIELWIENRENPIWLPNRIIEEKLLKELNDDETVFLKTDPKRPNIAVTVLFDNEEILKKNQNQENQKQARQQNRGRNNRQNDNQHQERDPAYAPYNFVPINDFIVAAKKFSDESIIPPFDRFAVDHHSGYIDLKIEAKTKVFIGSGSSETGNYKFFAPNGTPRIPGSSLRGMVRTLVEICSWGQFKFFENKQLFYRTFENSSMGIEFYRERMVGEYGQPKVRAGYLKKEGRSYKIIPALCDSSVCDTEFYRIDYSVVRTIFPYLNPFEEKTVFFQPKQVVNQSVRHSRRLDYALLTSVSKDKDRIHFPMEGKLIASGNMPGEHGKHMHWVINLYDKTNNPNYKNVCKDVIDTYRSDASRKIRNFDLLSRLKNQKEVPCFYLEESGKITAIGHTPYFRLPYKNKVGDLLPAEHKKFKGIDIPTAIFGNESSDDEEAGFAGRVYFEDALFDPASNNERARTYRGQSTAISPKPTSFQLYIKQDSTKVPKEELKHYDTVIGFDFAFQLLDKVIKDQKMHYDKTKGFDIAFPLLDELVKEQQEQNDTFKGFDSAFKSLEEDLKSKLINSNVTNGFGRAYQLLDEDLKHQLKHSEKEGFAGAFRLLDELLKKQLKQYDTARTLLRGNKLYWHKTPDRNNTEKLQFNNTRIRFTNLNSVELGALLFALDLPKGCCHKIGMGKPQGLGSIRITPTLYIEDHQKKYASFTAAMNYKSEHEKYISSFKETFENYIKEHPGIDNSRSSLWDHERMKQLKALLNYDTPPRNTGYMSFMVPTGELKPNGKPKEEFNTQFKERFILPKATEVK